MLSVGCHSCYEDGGVCNELLWCLNKVFYSLFTF